MCFLWVVSGIVVDLCDIWSGWWAYDMYSVYSAAHVEVDTHTLEVYIRSRQRNSHMLILVGWGVREHISDILLHSCSPSEKCHCNKTIVQWRDNLVSFLVLLLMMWHTWRIILSWFDYFRWSWAHGQGCSKWKEVIRLSLFCCFVDSSWARLSFFLCWQGTITIFVGKVQLVLNCMAPLLLLGNAKVQWPKRNTMKQYVHGI